MLKRLKTLDEKSRNTLATKIALNFSWPYSGRSYDYKTVEMLYNTVISSLLLEFKVDDRIGKNVCVMLNPKVLEYVLPCYY